MPQQLGVVVYRVARPLKIRWKCIDRRYLHTLDTSSCLRLHCDIINLDTDQPSSDRNKTTMAPPPSPSFHHDSDEEPPRAAIITTAEAAKWLVIASPRDFFQELWQTGEASPSAFSSSDGDDNSNSNSPDAAAVAVEQVEKEEEENAAAATDDDNSLGAVTASRSSIRAVNVIVHPTNHQRVRAVIFFDQSGEISLYLKQEDGDIAYAIYLPDKGRWEG